MKGKWIRVHVDTEIEYRNIQRLFTQEGIQYKSFVLDSEKHQKFVRRGFLPNAQIEYIQEYLNLEEIDFISVQQLTRGNTGNKIKLPLFLVQLPRLAETSRLFEISEIMGLGSSSKSIEVEKARSNAIFARGFSLCGSVPASSEVCEEFGATFPGRLL